MTMTALCHKPEDKINEEEGKEKRKHDRNMHKTRNSVRKR